MDGDDRASFLLTYDGPALVDGRMDVRDLAPALMSLGDLFQEANTVLNPEAPPLNLEIRAFSEGSFEVNLELIVGQVANLLASTPTIAAANLITIVGGGRGLFRFLTAMRRRRISREEETSAGTTTVTFDDGTTVETDSSVVVLVKRESTRRHAKGVVAPLRRDGVDELRIETPEEPPVIVSEDDSEALDAGDDADLLVDQEWEMAATIAMVSFTPGTKWRLSDGTRILWAAIEDEAFLDRVERAQESFSKGDILICRMRLRQWQTQEGLRTEYSVTHVERHIPASRDVQLPFIAESLPDDEPPDDEPPDDEPPALPG